MLSVTSETGIRAKLIISLLVLALFFLLPWVACCTFSLVHMIVFHIYVWFRRNELWKILLNWRFHDNASRVSEKHLNEMFIQEVLHGNRVVIKFCWNLKSSAFVYFFLAFYRALAFASDSGKPFWDPLSLLQAPPLDSRTRRSCSIRKIWVQIPALPPTFSVTLDK